jgi:hypothetical protein
MRSVRHDELPTCVVPLGITNHVPVSVQCSVCGQRTIKQEGESDPKLFTLGGLPKSLVVSDRDWDGSDIFGVDGPGGGVFFSARARAWFEHLHVFQVKFKDALIDTA